MLNKENIWFSKIAFDAGHRYFYAFVFMYTVLKIRVNFLPIVAVSVSSKQNYFAN